MGEVYDGEPGHHHGHSGTQIGQERPFIRQQCPVNGKVVAQDKSFADES